MYQKTRNGTLIHMQDGQDRLLRALYGCAAGRALIKPLTTPALSRLAGRFLSCRASRVLIRSFIRRYNIDMSQYVPEEYENYNEFFSRRILPHARHVDMDPCSLISPCDSKLTVLPISQDGQFLLKHTPYTVASLLRNPDLARAYEGGYALIFRLTVDDYHRYAYPCDAQTEPVVRIDGVLHTVNPIANDYFPIYKENCREYAVMHTRPFGDMVMIEVGALLVGKIVNHCRDASVVRGQEKGYFQFGGSTVMLLLKPGAAQIDEDILANSSEGIETIVKFGERIGRCTNNAEA